MQPPTQYLFKTFDLHVAGRTIKPEYWHAGVILILAFMIVLTLARYRQLKVKWGFQGFIPTLILGFVLAIIFEIGLLLSGKTLVSMIFGWENAPKPISTIIDESRGKMVQVLGESEESSGFDQVDSTDEILLLYTSLEQDEASSVKEIICRQD